LGGCRALIMIVSEYILSIIVKSPDKSARRDHNSRKQPAASGSSHARIQRVNGHPKDANRSPRAS